MVAFAREALADLAEIRAYIAAEYPERATRIVNDIITKCQRLDRFPMIGRPGLAPGTRELSTAKPWIIIYELVDNEVHILRVWHGSRNR